jgi:uncharacterized delta-60 repeat protein
MASLLLVAGSSHQVAAAPADLDTTFGVNGKVTTAIGSNDDFSQAVAIQRNGKILLAGRSIVGSTYDIAVVRYNTDGSLDTTFNGTGKVTTAVGSGEDIGRHMALQADGKIVVAGHSYSAANHAEVALVRYNTDGSLDTTFNGTGKVTTAVGGITDLGQEVIVQGDGKIIVVGDSFNGSNLDVMLLRYNANGSLDTTFNGVGKVTAAVGGGDDYGRGVALQTNGNIVVTGASSNGSNLDMVVLRYNTNGSLDTTFNGTGKVITSVGGGNDVGESVVVQGDGKILITGGSYNGNNYDFALIRYAPNGSLDTTFNGTGKVTTSIGSGHDYPSQAVLQLDGRILLGGLSHDTSGYDYFAVARYNANGTLDLNFNSTGTVTTHIGSFDNGGDSIALQSDGKFVVGGFSYNALGNADFAILRYEGDPDSDEDGILDIYETGTGIFVSPTDTGTNPTNPDSDADGLTDGLEVSTYLTNPNIKDTDEDGFDDGFEVSTGFNPASALSTPDALSSILTAVEYRFNAALGVSYRIETSTDLSMWTTLETPIIGNGGVITRFYSIEGQPRRFFRSRRN